MRSNICVLTSPPGNSHEHSNLRLHLKKYRWIEELKIKMNSYIFEEIIGKFSPSLRKDKTFQSIEHRIIIKDVTISDYNIYFR